MKKLFILGFAFIVIGTVCLIAQNEMLPYSPALEYERELNAVPYRNSERFYEVQDKYSTEKYRLLDTGILDIILGAMICLIAILKCRRILAAPRFLIVILAVLAPAMSGYGQVFALETSYSRSEFPSWADTLAIPFVGISIFFVLSLLFSLYHLSLLIECNADAVVLSSISEEWVMVMVVLNLIFIAESSYYGAWWEVMPSVVWFYFFASIGSRLPRKE
ncbi:hypothetical protein [Kiloniella sp.]|uniref:hypothetical protein n=1 Tax=Kiloniella sp. TaxID=1938587 RepID=UPI003B02A6E8